MPILSLHEVTKAFGGLVAVNRATFSVEPGSIHGLIGPNGAGKTTLFSLITGFYRPTMGRVELDGEDITRLSTSARARKGLVRTFQGTVLFSDLTVEENIANGMLAESSSPWTDWLFESPASRSSRQERAAAIMDYARLSDLRNVGAKDLSHGQQRVLGIAIALAAKPRLLLLDEPFTGMTASEKNRLAEMLRRIREDGATIVLVEHDMRTVMRLCDVITVLNFGSVLTEGTPEQVRRHPEVMAAYLGSAA
ncbi:ABC transporter ATP-binding protein [Mesorhizobium escarrei]|uniref:Branched chain amino acid/phenylalanine ABC transporter ATP binding subunit LivG n=1 Tax=Mesorhizobium escarrei TaxID=666018 RepID=A0ABN8KDN8_9HYPH|nr:ABC transporter ATP-binding protein [Mesorhizobium escarrei]CAH2408338.1 branched chain amino acid/phenylalanine ABC transporter ATP binding subunit LivG [Mesorhizobium escarrei]